MKPTPTSPLKGLLLSAATAALSLPAHGQIATAEILHNFAAEPLGPIDASGTVRLTSSFDTLDFSLVGSELVRLEGRIEGSVALDVEATASGSFLELVDLPFAADAPIPSGDYELTPAVLGQVTVSGNVEPGAHFGLNAQFAQDVDVLIDRTLGTVLVTSQDLPTWQVATPEGVLTTDDVQIQVDAFLSMGITHVPTGTIPAVAYGLASFTGRVDADALADPWWNGTGSFAMHAGLWLSSAGIQLPVTGIDVVLDLGDAGGPYPGAEAIQRWARSYDIHTIEHVTDAIVTADGGVAVVGEPGVGNNGWIAKLDGAGLVEWEYESQFGAAIDPVEVVEAPNGDLIVVGDSNGLRIERYGIDGTPLWATNTLSNTLGQTLHVEAATVTANGELIVVGAIATVGGWPFMARYDATGNLLWMQEWRAEPHLEWATFLDVVETTDGSILAVGDMRSLGTITPAIDDNYSGLAVRMSGDGTTVEWAMAYGSEDLDRIRSVTIDPAGNVTACGTIDGESFSSWMLGIDAASGSRTWSRTYAETVPYGVPGNTSHDTFLSVTAKPDGSVLATGVTGLAGTSHTWLLQVDALGQLQWFKSVGGTDLDELVGTSVFDDGVLAFGRTKSLGNTAHDDGLLLRGSYDGLVGFDPLSGMSMGSAAAYQAPTTDDAQAAVPLTQLLPVSCTVSAASFVHGAPATVVSLLSH